MRTDNPIESGFGQPRAVSVYDATDALGDFPVLKAFQQYIDAEQAKARKRLLAMGVFFGALTFAVIAIFVLLLVNVSSRNQQLNDRLIEFAMKDRAAGSPVVVQPPQDSAAILALTTRLEALQQKLAETQSKADRAMAEAEARVRQAVAAEATKPSPPSAETLEIQSLKAQLAAEKERASAEKERRREEELEAYRRKHYPELYAPRRPAEKADAVDRMLDDLERMDADEGEKEDDAATSPSSGSDPLLPVRYFDEGDESSHRPAGKSQATHTGPESQDARPDAGSHMISVKDGEANVNWGIPD